MKIDWNTAGEWLRPKNLLATAEKERHKKLPGPSLWKLILPAFLVLFLLGHPAVHLPVFAPQMLQPIVAAPAAGGGGAACTPMSGYLHCRILTIDHTQAGGSTLTNYAVLVNTNYGTNAQSASCFDHVYTSDSGGTTLIPWEQEHCTAPAVVVDWVLIASVSSSADTVFYVSYDNAGISTAQNTGANGPTHVWDAATLAVYHLKETLTTNGQTVADSTGTFPLTSQTIGTNWASGDQVAGEINGALKFIQSESRTVSANTTVAATNATKTVSFWFKPAASPSTGFLVAEGAGPSSGTLSWGVVQHGSVFAVYNPNTSYVDGTTAISAATWYRLDFCFNSSGNTINLYLNGSNTPELTSSGSEVGGSVAWFVIGGGFTWTDGILDEVKVSNSIRAAGWRLADFNSQKASATFVTVGTEH